MTKSDLNTITQKVMDLSFEVNRLSEKGNDMDKDVQKSFTILKKKLFHYLSNYEALNSLKEVGLDKGEK